MIRRTRARVASWLASRGASYTQAVVALALNIPFMVAVLGRYPQGLTWASFEGVYALLVFAGYYVFAVYLLVTVAFLLTGAWRRVFLSASTAILTRRMYHQLRAPGLYQVQENKCRMPNLQGNSALVVYGRSLTSRHLLRGDLLVTTR